MRLPWLATVAAAALSLSVAAVAQTNSGGNPSGGASGGASGSSSMSGGSGPQLNTRGDLGDNTGASTSSTQRQQSGASSGSAATGQQQGTSGTASSNQRQQGMAGTAARTNQSNTNTTGATSRSTTVNLS